MQEQCKVAVIADWDADGVVGAALIYYAQEKKGVFPVKGREKVCLIPAGPRSIVEEMGEECWDNLVIVDIPVTDEVIKALAAFRERCSNSKIYYFDHHSSTLKNIHELEDKYNVFAVVGKSPSSVIIKRFLEGLNVRFTRRLEDFVAAIAVLEGSSSLKRQVDVSQKLVEMAAAISKMLNVTRSREAWVKYVRWLANPLPFEDPGVRLAALLKESEGKVNLLEASEELSKKADEEVRRVATELAMSAVNLGYVKFVDARGKWNKRGASALASAIYKIVGQPVAVLFERADGTRLLVIRSGRGEASRILDILREQGIVEDKGGHGNIAVARLNEAVTVRMLEQALRRAAFEAARRSSSNIW